MGSEQSDTGISQAKTLLTYAVAWVLLGYGGYQLAGWTGAILVPIGVIFGMALLFAPFVVLVVGTGLVIHTIKGIRAAKRYISRGAGR